jgi:hypothetical protein
MPVSLVLPTFKSPKGGKKVWAPRDREPNGEVPSLAKFIWLPISINKLIIYLSIS